MNSIAQNKRYCPHKIKTKVSSVKLYRETKDIAFVCRRYHISKASLMRWNKLYDGTEESLMPKSHRPLSPHPNAHTEKELKWICDYHRRNPNISVSELYGKLRDQKAYKRHPVLFTVSLSVSDFAKRPNLQRKKQNTQGSTILPQNSALSGSLM